MSAKLKVDVLLPNTSQYEVLHHFSAKLREAFQRLGFQARLLSKAQYEQAFFNDPPQLTVGFNGAPKDINGEFFCDITRIPHLSCLVDPPFRFLGLQASPYILIACDDKACTDLFRSPQNPRYYFMPHGVEPELAPDLSLTRDYDVVFLGSFIDSDRRRLRWRDRFPAAVCASMEEAAEAALADESLHFARAFLDNVNRRAQDGGVEAFNLAEALQEVELFLKARDRVALIRSITSCDLHIFGSTIEETSWDELFAGQPNVHVHPAVNYSEALQVMRQAKIVLNSSVKSVYGAHERVFSGMAAGAVVMSSANPFLRESFEEGKEILFYRPGSRSNIDDTLRTLLAEEGACAEVARMGRAKVMREHTWDSRLKALLPEVMPVIERLIQ